MKNLYLCSFQHSKQNFADTCLRLARQEETPFSLLRCKVTDDCKTGQISRCPHCE